MRKRGSLLTITIAAACLWLAAPASAALFTVNFAADGNDTGINGVCDAGGGACTLRAAIQEANANTGSTDRIDFAIPGPGVQTLGLTVGELPTITQPVIINGYSQPGSSPNTAATGTNAVIQIVLDGSALAEANGFSVNSGGTTIRGLNIRGFNDPNPLTFDGAAVICFNVAGNTGNHIAGNFIGTNVTGTASIDNAEGGVKLFGPNSTENLVGGNSRADLNLISGNEADGVSVSSNSNEVSGNLIGVAADGLTPLANDGDGISVFGLNNAIRGNTIASNIGDGVQVGSGTGNRVLDNSIFENSNLGIDLNPNGVTPNDDGDADAGANNLQNFPTLTAAANAGGATTVVGSLASTTGGSFEVQFFSSPAADPSGSGEGKTLLGSTNVADGNGDGVVPLSFGVFPELPLGTRVTATATNLGGDTSEFSNAVAVEAAPAAPNQGPEADPDDYATAEDQAFTVPDGPDDLLANDDDPEGGPLTAAVVSGPSDGTLELKGDGSFAYTPGPNVNGEDSFRYVASDGTDTSDPGTVRISVDPVNDPPAITVLAPKEGSKTKDDTPKVKADVTDVESELGKRDLKLRIDGQKEKGFSYRSATDRVKLVTDELSAGKHRIKLTATDDDGATTVTPWSFKVVG